jgi:hypothetical protein
VTPVAPRAPRALDWVATALLVAVIALTALALAHALFYVGCYCSPR